MTKQSNVSAFVSAASDLNSGRAYEASGMARLVMALRDWIVTDREFLATIKSGTTTTVEPFRVTDYPFDVIKADGGKCGKSKPARMVAMITAMGLPEGMDTNPIAVAIPRVLPTAILLAKCPTAKLKENGKFAIIVGVPVHLALSDKLEDTDNKPTKLRMSILASIIQAASLSGDEIDEAQAEERLEKATVPLSGAEVLAFGKLPTISEFNRDVAKPWAIEAGRMPEPAKRAARAAQPNELEAFTSSLSFLTDKMREQVEGDEATLGMTAERVSELRTLAILLAAFLEGEEA